MTTTKISKTEIHSHNSFMQIICGLTDISILW